MNKIEMGKALTVIMRAWNYMKVDDDLISIWYAAFGKESAEDFMKAALSVMKEHTGAPEMANINKALKLMRQPEKQLTEGEAWGALMTAVRRFGWPNPGDAMHYLRKIDPHLAQVTAQFGWRSICEWETKDNAINRAHLWKCIASLKSRQEKFESLGIQEDPNKIGNSDRRISEAVQQLLPKMGIN
jgi:hypothetical protein